MLPQQRECTVFKRECKQIKQIELAIEGKLRYQTASWLIIRRQFMIGYK